MSQQIDRDRDALAAHAHRYGTDDDRTALPETATEFPSVPSTMPMILDTDIGGDPDDAIALIIAAQISELQLVLTSDEHQGRRAHLARHLLDLLDRADVPVIAGRDLGNTRYWSLPDAILPTDNLAATNNPDPIEAVVRLVDQADSPVRWVGIGPASNLADLLTRRPDLADRLEIAQMGGGFPYRHTSKAEHNVRLDIQSFRTLLTTANRPWLVPSDVTFHPDNEITADSPEYKLLTEPDGPVWAPLMRAHLDTWFRQFYPGTMQHDAITLATAIRMPFLDIDRVPVALDHYGHTHFASSAATNPPDTDQNDPPTDTYLVRKLDRSAFRTWLRTRLTGPD